MPSELEDAALVLYRSSGLGIYGAVLRWAGMPLERIAIIMNSSQVSSAKGDLARLALAIRLTFADGGLAPYRVVGRASLIAWSLQYSVMGFVFMICDASLSRTLGIPRVVYGDELMQPAGVRAGSAGSAGGSSSSGSARAGAAGASSSGESGVKPSLAVAAAAPIGALGAAKMVIAPILSGSIESSVANRAEVQRYYGIDKFAQIEKQLNWGAVRRACGPAFVANASRNFVMSSTSFVLTPVTFKNFYPQEKKTTKSLFWYGLGMNIFVGNTIAITQQALWGRALDYGAVNGGRTIVYKDVVREGLKVEGVAAFYTPAKWFTRVLMNAPVQGTLPWFYNEVLPRFEGPVRRAVAAIAPQKAS